MAKLKDSIGTTATNVLDGVTIATSVAVDALVVMDSWLTELYNQEEGGETLVERKTRLLGTSK